jgi:hypothetical protein
MITRIRNTTLALALLVAWAVFVAYATRQAVDFTQPNTDLPAEYR